jgi:UDP-glucose:(heptosyl)LPS alpha-1,3-glucosyltransferase
LRLAIVRQRYNPYGGAERFLENALTGLGRESLEVTMIARDWPMQSQSAYQRIMVKTFSIGRTWRDAAFAKAACAAVVKGKFDLVQSHERLVCCDIFRAGDGVHREWLIQRARLRGGISILFDNMSMFHRRILSAERNMFASPRLKAVICNSSMVKNEIIQHYNVVPERLIVIPNAVNAEKFHPGLRSIYRTEMRARLGLSDSQPVFLFVGSGFERKGIHLLLDIWPKIDATLIVVGHDRELKRYRQQAAALGKKIYFAGPQLDVKPWYGMADVFVLPTLYDPLPNAALEALACGLPTLTSTKSGAAEWIKMGVTGDVADAFDKDTWVNLLIKWSDLNRCRVASSDAVLTMQQLSPMAMQDKFRELYKNILNSYSNFVEKNHLY